MMMPRFQAPRMLSYPPLHNLECVLIVVVIYGGEMFSGCLAGQLGGGEGEGLCCGSLISVYAISFPLLTSWRKCIVCPDTCTS